MPKGNTMKKALILMLISAACFAETVATSENQGGGLMVLTDIPCKDKRTFVVYSQQPRTKTITGCWFTDDQFVHVVWQDGDFRSYSFGIWTVKQKKESY